MNRRNYLYTILTGLIAAPFVLLFRKTNKRDVIFWQIDPTLCTQCGRCETECILKPSAVKCVHQYAACGYCLFCSGYYHDNRASFDTAGENLRCPTDALVRRYIEGPYFEYTINDEDKCVGCGKCVKGCKAFGNGSLFLQVRHGLCKHCNQCRIATVCPADALVKVSATEPYLFKYPPQSEYEAIGARSVNEWQGDQSTNAHSAVAEQKNHNCRPHDGNAKHHRLQSRHDNRVICQMTEREYC